jgi:hypothetical protein
MSSYALAGSIPTEFGKLINMKALSLRSNNLTGTVCSFCLVWYYKSTTCFKNVGVCAGRVYPHGIRQAGEPETPLSLQQPTDRYGLLILPGVVVRVYDLL